MAFGDLTASRLGYARMFILAGLVAICVLLEAVVHVYLGITVVYTHFFYIPVVLAALWYGVRSVILAALLGGMHLLTSSAITGSLDTGALGRALMLVLAALVIGAVVEYMKREQEQVLSQVASAALQGEVQRGGLWENLEEWKARTLSSANVKRLKKEGNVPALVQALRNRNPGVQYDAAEALGELGDPSSVGPLMAAFSGDRYSGVRWKAAEALARIGVPAIGPLVQALSHPDEDVRWMAAIALGEIGDPQAIGPLVRLLGDPDRFVQSRAAFALGELGPEAVGPLMAALREGDPGTREGAARALGLIADTRGIEPLLGALGDPEETVRDAALSALPMMGEEGIRALVRFLKGAGDSEAIIEAFHGLPDHRASETLRALLPGADEDSARIIRALLED